MARPAIAIQMGLHLIDRDLDRKLRRVVVHAAADGGKGDGVEVFAPGHRQALSITGGEQFWLAEVATPPHGAYGVIDTLDWKTEPRGSTDVAGRAPANLAAGLQKFGPGGPMNGPIDTTASEEPLVGGVDDYIHM